MTDVKPGGISMYKAVGPYVNADQFFNSHGVSKRERIDDIQDTAAISTDMLVREIFSRANILERHPELLAVTTQAWSEYFEDTDLHYVREHATKPKSIETQKKSTARTTNK